MAVFFGCWFVGWLLAEANHFSHLVGATIVATFVAMLAALMWRFVAPCEPHAAGARSRRALRGAVLLIVGGLGATRYVHLPERITANNDQGSYTLQAVWLAHHGSPRLRARALAESTPDFRQLLIDERPMQAQRDVARESRHPYYLGFFVQDEAPGTLHSQFPAAYPVLLASAYVVGGWTAMQGVNVALLLSAALVAAMLAQRWWGTLAAVVTLAGTCLFPLHIWLVNSWFAEGAVMLTWLLALLALDDANDPIGRTRLVALGSGGVALALGIGAKLDGLAGLTVLPFLLAAAWRAPSMVGRAVRLMVCAAPVVVSAALLWHRTTGYGSETLRSIASHLSRNVLLIACGAMAAACVGYRVVLRQSPASCDGPEKHGRSLVTVARWVIAAGWLGGLAYFYFVRSAATGSDHYYYWPYRTTIASYREATTVRLGWYFTPIGLWATFAAVGWMIVTAKRAAHFAWLLAGAGTLLLFCYDLHNNPIQPYAMRRFLAYATSLLIVSLGGVLAAVGYGRRGARVIAAVAALAWLAAFVHIDERLNGAGDATGFAAQLRDLANRIPANAVVVSIAGNPTEELMAPLELMHGRTVVLLKSPPRDGAQRAALQQQLLDWQNAGKPLWALTPTTYLPLGGAAVEAGTPPISGEIIAGRLAPVVDREPGARLQQRWRYQLRPIRAAPTFR